jgi:protein disulfide-isomerase A6
VSICGHGRSADDGPIYLFIRLASILSKRTISPAKLDEIKIKANILGAFVNRKLEEAQEKVESVIGRATAEL